MARCWAVYMLESRSCKYDDVFYENIAQFFIIGHLHSVKKARNKLLYRNIRYDTKFECI